MPIRVSNDLPAKKVLERENIFVMPETRAMTQDIRPLKIIILNLMPTKIETETQLLRLLGNSPLQVDIELLQMSSHKSKNTSKQHLTTFYKVFDDIKDNKYDGLIVTGAPVETLEYDKVDYWDELETILNWAKKNVYSTMFICWGAQAGLYHRYQIPKYEYGEKLCGIYSHKIINREHPLMRGLNEEVLIPHSRYTGIRREDVEKHDQLIVLASNEKAGVSIICSKNGREFYLLGHSEYDKYTLSNEYFRDISRGLNPKIPYNYFPDDNPDNEPLFKWHADASILFSNWLNYYLYQQTPYDLEQLKKMYE